MAFNEDEDDHEKKEDRSSLTAVEEPNEPEPMETEEGPSGMHENSA